MSAAPKTIYLKDYKPYPFVLASVELDFVLDDHATKVSSRIQMQRNPKSDESNAAVVLNGQDVKLVSVAIDGNTLTDSDYSLADELLTIPVVPDQFELAIEVEIDPKNNTQLMGLYQSRGNYCTQCEAHGFRRITFFPDRPDVMTTFTVSIIGDKKTCPYLLSNGNLIEEKTLDGGLHFAKWHDPSLKPCYLFALVAGDFDLIEDEFITMSGRNVDLRLFLEKGYREQGHYAMASLKRSMKWDEEVYGREYDLDIFMTVAVSDFNFGAMENKGLNIFNTKYILADARVATDTDYVLIEDVVGHEYFHNWSGDRVTCRDWFQITLKEGFTVLRDQGFSEDMTSKPVRRIDEVNIIRTNQFLQDAGPMAHPIRPESYIEINNFYTVTVYNKGAEVIRMVRTMLGQERFRKATDLYFDRFDGQAVTTDDFLVCMQEVSGKDLTQFKRWYNQAGTPVLDVTDEYDADSQTYRLTVKQSCAETADGSPKLPFHIPLAIGFLDSDGNDMPLQLEESVVENGVLNITEAEQTFEFVNVEEQPLPSFLRHFSAPVKLHYDYSDSDLAYLMVNDNDSFNRWDASQQLSTRLLLSLIADAQAGKAMVFPSMLAEAFAAVLESEQDYALAARSITLPSENYLAQQMTVADPDAIHQAREFVRQGVAEHLQETLRDVYQRLDHQKPFEYNAQAMGERSLKNLSLAYLSTLQEDECAELAYQQYSRADNMTDRMGALAALNNTDCMQRGAALESFYVEFENEALVMDKWLSLQASSYLPGTLDAVKKLMQSPAYDAKNPNKIRSLIAAFANNQAQFHQLSGAGYDFLAEQVIAVDKINPMTASRILEPLTRWKMFDEKRQGLMKAALQKILDSGKLSKDVYEVTGKSLL